MSDLNSNNCNHFLVKKKHKSIILKADKNLLNKKSSDRLYNDKKNNSGIKKRGTMIKKNKDSTCYPSKKKKIKVNDCCLLKMNIPENNLILKINLYYIDYEEAIKYEKRKFSEILCSMLVLKQKLINIFCFSSPLELKPLRICLVLFIYSCNFSMNTLFYFNKNISDKYHYQGNDLYLFSLINNISICVISTALSSTIVFLLNFLIKSKKEIQENLRDTKNSKIAKNLNVNTDEGKKIFIRLTNTLNRLRKKVILFFIIELMLLLFFFYFTTAFCEVYKSTQITWIIDCSISFIISLFVEIMISFIVSVLYKLSVNNKNSILYKILTVLL